MEPGPNAISEKHESGLVNERLRNKLESQKCNVLGQEDSNISSSVEPPLKSQVKGLTDSTVGLQNLENKLKEVESKLIYSKSDDSSPSDKSNMDNKQDTASTSSSVQLESTTSINNPLIENTTSVTAQTNIREAGSVMTPQNEKEFAEVWSMLGVQRCRFCKFSTDNKELFQQHTTTCTPKVSVEFSNGIYICETCDLTWTSKAEFEEHVVCHTTNDPYVCIKCKKAFESRFLTEQHAKADHPSGGSIYGLRGMKKSRKIVEELERLGKHQFKGKVIIPATPRNKQLPSLTSQVNDAVNKEEPPKTRNTTSETSSTNLDMHEKPEAVSVNIVGVENTSKKVCESFENESEEQISTKNFAIRNDQIAEVSIRKESSNSVQTNDLVKSEDENRSKVQINESNQSYTVSSGSTDLVSTNSKLATSQNDTLTINASPSNVPDLPTSKKDVDSFLRGVAEQTALPSVVPNSMKITPLNIANPLSITNQNTSQSVYKNSGSHTSQTNQNAVQQGARQYQFTEYVGPPAQKPKASPTSIKPLPPLSGNVQTTMPQILPTPIQPKTTPILLIPLPPVFNNPSSSLSNVLIPLQPGNQGGQSLVNNFMNYTVQNTATAPTSQPVTVKKENPNIPGTVSQFSQRTVCTASTTALVNTLMSSTPQLVLSPTTSVQNTVQTLVSKPEANKMDGSSVPQQIVPVSQYITSSANIPVQVNTVINSKPGILSSTALSSHQSGNRMPPPAYGKLFHNPVAQTSKAVSLLSKDKVGLISSSVVTPNTNIHVSADPLPPPVYGQSILHSKLQTTTAERITFRKDTTGISTTTVVNSNTNTNWIDNQKDKTTVNASVITSASKNLVPTVEIAVLPDKQQGHQLATAQSDQSNVLQGQHYNLSKRFLFRIKPGHGFVCEACRKFTQDEVIFRRHVWDHFHTVTRSCKFCNYEKVQKKDFLNCSLVSNVVCSLVKKSTGHGQLSSAGGTPEKAISVVDDEVIDISDDEDNSRKTDEKSNASSGSSLMKQDDVIVLDDEEVPKIKITGTYSLSSTDRQTTQLRSDLGAEQDTGKENVNNTAKNSDFNEKHFGEDKVVETPVSLTMDDIRHPDTNEKHTETEVASVASMDLSETNRTGSITQPEEVKSNESSSETLEKVRHQSKGNPELKAKISHFEKLTLTNKKELAFYICGFDQCSFTSLVSQKYKDHLAANHYGAYSYVCCHCGLKNYTEDTHVRHVTSHGNVKVFLLFHCPVKPCKYKTNLIHMFKAHIQTHKEQNLKCTYCHHSFESPEMLVNHLKSNLIKYISCPSCHFKFQSKDVVIKHIRLCHPDKPRLVTVSSQIVCLERELNFYNPPLMVTGTKQDLQNAADLPVVATQLDSLQNKRSITKDQNFRPTDSSSSSMLTDGLSQKRAKDDTKNTHISLQNDSKTSEAPRSLLCVKCNFLSWNYKLHKQHQNLHEDDEPERDKRFVCMYCPKGFDVITQFKTHVSNHVGRHEIKIYSCTLCVFTTSQRYHIIDHCKDNHLGTGTYVQRVETVVSKEASCKYCEFKSRKAEDVQLHEKVVHLNPPKPNVVTENKDLDLSTKETEEDQLDQETTLSSKKVRKYHCHYCMEYFKHKADLRTHMETSHLDIENKNFVTFKCKYCHFTSTIKALIITHIEKKHADKQIRILRRIENIVTQSNISGQDEEKVTYYCKTCDFTVDSQEKLKSHFAKMHSDEVTEMTKEKETIYIPDGNFFKEPVHCPKCTYSNKLRVNILRHIKLHPELAPSRGTQSSDSVPSKVTARKSTSKQSPFKVKEKELSNPFKAVKDAVQELDRKEADSKKVKQLCLGDNQLHNKLLACFIPHENDYKCKICEQKIAKKFVLHRHILNHLNIVFFKCQYCDNGDIEQSLISGHIQQEHPLKPVLFETLNITELSEQIKKKILALNLSVDAYVPGVSVDSPFADDASNQVDDTQTNHQGRQKIVFKCGKCEYFARTKYHLALHRKDHLNPGLKKYGCTACGYRGTVKVDVVRHIKRWHPNHPLNIIVGNIEKQEDTSQAISENSTSGMNIKVDNMKGLQLESSKDSKTISDSITMSDNGVFERKPIYKCKHCGEKKNSKWAIYAHFRNTKCRKPLYKCKACAFTNQYKNAISKHSKLRHIGKKVEIVELPVSAKVRLIKIPVKQDDQTKSLEGGGKAPNMLRNPKNISKFEEKKGNELQENSETYVCSVCHNYRSDSLSKLQFHMNTKHQGKPLICTTCDYKTPLVKHIINHCVNVHNQQNASYTVLDENEDSGNEQGNENTYKKSLSRADVEGDLSKTQTRKKYKCVECDISKDNIKMLRDHMQIHFGYKPFVCKYCSAQLQHLTNVRRHINICHQGKTVKYSMVKIDKIEKKLDQLISQVLNDTNLKQNENNMSEIHHNTVDQTKIKKKSSKRSLEVDEGSKLSPHKKKARLIEEGTFKSKKGSEDERDSAELSPMKYRVVREPGTSTKFFQCVQCDYKTSRRPHLQKHVKNKHGKQVHKCSHCDYVDRYISNVYRHIQYHHKGMSMKVIQVQNNDRAVSPISDEPASGSSNRSSKTSHKMVALKYFCNVCDFAVIGLYHYRQHLATHEEFRYLRKGSDIESRLSCGYCSYMAIDDLDFSTHIASHLDERPFECGYCDYSSYQRKNILVHIAGCHPGEPELVLDNRDKMGNGGKLKVKQTLLVDFDPQIILKRIDDTVPKMESERERGPLKLTLSLNKFTNSYSDRNNIFSKFGNEDHLSDSKNEEIASEENDKEYNEANRPFSSAELSEEAIMDETVSNTIEDNLTKSCVGNGLMKDKSLGTLERKCIVDEIHGKLESLKETPTIPNVCNDEEGMESNGTVDTIVNEPQTLASSISLDLDNEDKIKHVQMESDHDASSEIKTVLSNEQKRSSSTVEPVSDNSILGKEENDSVNVTCSTPSLLVMTTGDKINFSSCDNIHNQNNCSVESKQTDNNPCRTENPMDINETMPNEIKSANIDTHEVEKKTIVLSANTENSSKSLSENENEPHKITDNLQLEKDSYNVNNKPDYPKSDKECDSDSLPCKISGEFEKISGAAETDDQTEHILVKVKDIGNTDEQMNKSPVDKSDFPFDGSVKSNKTYEAEADGLGSSKESQPFKHSSDIDIEKGECLMDTKIDEKRINDKDIGDVSATQEFGHYGNSQPFDYNSDNDGMENSECLMDTDTNEKGTLNEKRTDGDRLNSATSEKQFVEKSESDSRTLDIVETKSVTHESTDARALNIDELESNVTKIPSVGKEISDKCEISDAGASDIDEKANCESSNSQTSGFLEAISDSFENKQDFVESERETVIEKEILKPSETAQCDLADISEIEKDHKLMIDENTDVICKKSISLDMDNTSDTKQDMFERKESAEGNETNVDFNSFRDSSQQDSLNNDDSSKMKLTSNEIMKAEDGSEPSGDALVHPSSDCSQDSNKDYDTEKIQTETSTDVLTDQCETNIKGADSTLHSDHEYCTKS